ncbi:hypothetical protein T439DRAFT_375710 [Meredithblackwellia eburnea MCA 4105]
MLTAPITLHALFALSLFASSPLVTAKPQPHPAAVPGQSALEAADASLFERYVASHLRAYHRHVTPAVSSDQSPSHLSTLLKNAHSFVVAGKTSNKDRGTKMLQRAAVLADGASLTEQQPDLTPPTVTLRERKFGKTGSLHLSGSSHLSRNVVPPVVQNTVKEIWTVVRRAIEPEEVSEAVEDVSGDDNDDDEEDWGWMDDGDEEDSEGDEEELTEEDEREATTVAARMEIRMRRLGDHIQH